MRQSRPEAAHARRSTACGPTTVPAPISAPGWTIGARHRSVDARRACERPSGDQPHQQLGFRRDLVADVRHARAPGPAVRAAARASPRGAGGRRARPAGGTWRCRRRAGRRAPTGGRSPARVSRMVATCASVSIISTPGISGAPGKCPWKNSSLTVTFLTATTRRPGSCSVIASTSGDG